MKPISTDPIRRLSAQLSGVIEFAPGDILKKYLPGDPSFNDPVDRAHTRAVLIRKTAPIAAPSRGVGQRKAMPHNEALAHSRTQQKVAAMIEDANAGAPGHEPNPPKWKQQPVTLFDPERAAEHQSIIHTQTPRKTLPDPRVAITPEQRATRSAEVSRRAAKTRDPIAWLKAQKESGSHTSLKIEDRGTRTGKTFAPVITEGSARIPGRPGKAIREQSEKYAQKLQEQAQNYRDSLAQKLKGRRALIQEARGVHGTTKTDPSIWEHIANRQESAGNSEIGIKGVANRPNRPVTASVPIGGKSHPNLPNLLDKLDAHVTSESKREAQRLSDQHKGVMGAIRKRVGESVADGGILSDKDRHSVNTITAKLRPQASGASRMSAVETEELARHLRIKPASASKIPDRMRAMRGKFDTAGGREQIRSKVMKDFFTTPSPKVASESYVPGRALKITGRTIGAAGLIGAGLYAGKKIRDASNARREQKQIAMSSRRGLIRFGKLTPLAERLIKASEAAGGGASKVKAVAVNPKAVTIHGQQIPRVKWKAQQGIHRLKKQGVEEAIQSGEVIPKPLTRAETKGLEGHGNVGQTWDYADGPHPVEKYAYPAILDRNLNHSSARIPAPSTDSPPLQDPTEWAHETVRSERHQNAERIHDIHDLHATEIKERQRAARGTLAIAASGAGGLGYIAGRKGQKKEVRFSANLRRSSIAGRFAVMSPAQKKAALIGAAVTTPIPIPGASIAGATIGAKLAAPAPKGMGEILSNRIPANPRAGQADGYFPDLRPERIMRRIQSRPTARLSSKVKPIQFGMNPLQNLRNKLRPEDKSTAGHDIATGGLEGGLGIFATDPLYRKVMGEAAENPFKGGLPKIGKKFAVGAGIGALATGLIGAGVSAASKKKRDSEPVFSAKRKLIQFARGERISDAMRIGTKYVSYIKEAGKKGIATPGDTLARGSRAAAALAAQARKDRAWKRTVRAAHANGMRDGEMKANGKLLAVGAGAGVAAGAAGTYIATRKKEQQVQFDSSPVAPGTRTRVATDRYVKKIHEDDIAHAESGYLRTGLGSSAIGALTAKRFGVTKGKAAAIAGLAGIGTQAAVRAYTGRDKDQFGDRSFAGKRIDRIPSQVAGVAALGLAGKAAHDKLQAAKIAAGNIGRKVKIGALGAAGLWAASKLFSSKQPIIRFGLVDDYADSITEPRYRRTYGQADRLNRHMARGGRLLRDIKIKASGKENLDERGRKRRSEWEKPWVRNTATTVGVAGALMAGKKLKVGIAKMANEAALAGHEATGLGKLAQQVHSGNAWRAVKKKVGAYIPDPVKAGAAKAGGFFGDLKRDIKNKISGTAAKANEHIESEVGNIITVGRNKEGTIAKTKNTATIGEKIATAQAEHARAEKDFHKAKENLQSLHKSVSQPIQRVNEAASGEWKKKDKIIPHEFSRIGRTIRFDQWDIEHRSANTAVVKGPGYTTRKPRREKKPWERKAVREAIGTGLIGAAAIGGYKVRGAGLKAAASARSAASAIEEAELVRQRAVQAKQAIGLSSTDPIVRLNSLLDTLIA